jgi:adenine phosphoribosyltransferase
MDAGVTKVCGIEARGFLLGGAVALRLGVGFAGVRKAPALFPGDKVAIDAVEDYRGVNWRLLIQTDSLDSGDRVVLVDDWAERGSQAVAARQLIEACGAAVVGISVIVDQLTDEVRRQLPVITAVVGYDELPRG